MKKILGAIVVLVVFGAAFVSCGGSNGNNGNGTTNGSGNTTHPSHIAIRAFISNALQPAGAAGAFVPVINIIDDTNDLVSTSSISLSGTLTDAGMMVFSPDKSLTMVLAPSENAIAMVDNATEAVGDSSKTSSAPVRLPGPTESFLLSGDNSIGYAAVPSATVTGFAPGAIEVFNTSTAGIVATVPVAGVRYLVESSSGNRILAFGETSNAVSVVTPSSIGTSLNPVTPICCFDHPSWAIFGSDGVSAYVFNCGPECGGTTAGISILNLNTQTVGPLLPVPGGATYGLLSGNTMYAVGTPPGTSCAGSTSPTAATSCGEVSVVDLTAMQVTGSAIITDGYHHLMQMGSNGQLFIGATNCASINTSSEVRGCLSIFNTTNAKVVVPPETGDATGIQPIATRNVVYVCQGGVLFIYDTTTDALQTTQITLVGDMVDVKAPDQ